LVVEFDDDDDGGDEYVYEISLNLAATILEALLEAFLMLDSPMLKLAGEEPLHLRFNGRLFWPLHVEEALCLTLDLNAVLQTGNFVVT
jgi:hypothetical protein